MKTNLESESPIPSHGFHLQAFIILIFSSHFTRWEVETGEKEESDP